MSTYCDSSSSSDTWSLGFDYFNGSVSPLTTWSSLPSPKCSPAITCTPLINQDGNMNFVPCVAQMPRNSPTYIPAHPGSYSTYMRYSVAYRQSLNTYPTTSSQDRLPLAPFLHTAYLESRHSTPPITVERGPPPAFPGNTHKVGDPNTGERIRVGTDGVRRMSKRRRVRDAAYVCSYPDCGASFTARHNLKAHETSHSGQRDYICACGSSFMRATDMRRHQLKSCPLSLTKSL